MRPLALALLLLCACDTREAMEPRQRFEITRAAGDIDEAERVAATGGDPTFACRAVRQTIVSLSSRSSVSISEVVQRGRTRCLALSLAFARTRVAKLESVKPGPGKGGGRERLAAECVELARAIALAKDLAPEDSEVAALGEKRKVLCP